MTYILPQPKNDAILESVRPIKSARSTLRVWSYCYKYASMVTFDWGISKRLAL